MKRNCVIFVTAFGDIFGTVQQLGHRLGHVRAASRFQAPINTLTWL
ncbi:hypothetical protein SNOG_06518 [Parastagonospora nodorum SN15]|uniref:Uncharacterized protein n=1 Tax=Phaeosphaeria nodorum (strain SN15 / ATCC MYA-4574 / FGSC 10173) TaxID=321614 RepID=Q0UNZ6_PHANO|nr:hypothetical protein SNOG_06518 [Parastagonospora nodorum SN15]EAT86349.1 hypothetical protein SNOG_06518 [Parastagonospora nodorum SN15]